LSVGSNAMCCSCVAAGIRCTCTTMCQGTGLDKSFRARCWAQAVEWLEAAAQQAVEQEEVRRCVPIQPSWFNPAAAAAAADLSWARPRIVRVLGAGRHLGSGLHSCLHRKGYFLLFLSETFRPDCLLAAAAAHCCCVCCCCCRLAVLRRRSRLQRRRRSATGRTQPSAWQVRCACMLAGLHAGWLVMRQMSIILGSCVFMCMCS
jgi:hypothetical protein